MADTYTHLRLLIASPDDVAEERAIVRDLIDEFNKIWSGPSSVWLESVSWESDIHPGFGEDAQDVVNQQIGDKYDIFVGILWNRFGSPTTRAGSGTEEEFRRAYDRFKADPLSVRLMMYFSRVGIEDPYLLDTEQVNLVRKFGNKIAKLGGLYKRYGSYGEFGEQFRLHLATVVQEWGKSWGTIVKKEPENAVEKAASTTSTHRAQDVGKGQDEPAGVTQEAPLEPISLRGAQPANRKVAFQTEEGFLNLIEEGAEQVDVVTKSAERMTEAIRVLGERMNSRAKQLKSLKLGPDITSVRIVRRIADETAREMMEFVDVVDGEVPGFADGYSRMLDVYGRAALLLTEGSQPNTSMVENTLTNLAGLRTSLVGSQGSLRAFHESIETIPPMSSDLIRAQKRSSMALGRLDQEWGRAINLSAEVEQMLRNVLPPSKPAKTRRRKKTDRDADTP